MLCLAVVQRGRLAKTSFVLRTLQLSLTKTLSLNHDKSFYRLTACLQFIQKLIELYMAMN